MQTRRQRRCSRARGYTLVEILMITAITGIFVAATAPVMQEMLGHLGSIQSLENRDAVQDTWTNHLRADLWAGRQVTLRLAQKPDTIIPAAGSALPSVTWTLDPAAAITRATAPTADSDGIKTFQSPAQSIHASVQPGSLRITITHTGAVEPTLCTMPLHTGGKP